MLVLGQAHSDVCACFSCLLALDKHILTIPPSLPPSLLHRIRTASIAPPSPPSTGIRTTLLSQGRPALTPLSHLSLPPSLPPPLLPQNKNSEYCAPLTSFDWNKDDPSLLGTACIDTTCTIWDVNTQQAKTQIIAHDKEVYDIGEEGVEGRREGGLHLRYYENKGDLRKA